MRVTRDNYEEYALDYVEGELDTSNKQAFEKFLDENPDIKEEFDDFSIVTIAPDIPMVYKEKSKLYQKEKKAVIIPLWTRLRGVAAVAVVLLVATTLWFAINNNLQENNPPIVDDISTVAPNSNTGQDNNLAENIADEVTQNGSSTTNIDERQVDIISKSEPDYASVKDINEEESSDIVEVMDETLEIDLNPNSNQDLSTEIQEIDRDIEEREKEDYRTELAMLETITELPKIEWTATSDIDLSKKRLLTIKKNTGKSEIEIHIPGEFLSETWSDVSFAQFKEKLIPEFLRTE
ncbi:hypothetical protein [Membranihabitans maritimus]|uniref:hypothetical protein n=1 Tax=Membranihabitans maritimus TaxID=2904244 RepID=UPI001F490A16|nr:hypothetical protein [Membranihabitans maritimus]